MIRNIIKLNFNKAFVHGRSLSDMIMGNETEYIKSAVELANAIDLYEENVQDFTAFDQEIQDKVRAKWQEREDILRTIPDQAAEIIKNLDESIIRAFSIYMNVKTLEKNVKRYHDLMGGLEKTLSRMYSMLPWWKRFFNLV